MNIIFLAQYLVSPSQPGSGRPWQTAKYFGQQGHQVQVLYSDVDYSTGRPRKEPFPRGDCLPSSVALHQIKSLGFGKSLFSRASQYFWYSFLAVIRGLRFRQIDLVLASSPPIFVGLAGYLLAWAKRAKFVLEIRDPWPAAPVYFGVLKNRLLIWLLLKLEAFLYRRADLIIAVTPGMKRHILSKGVRSEKVEVITTGYDPELYQDYPPPQWHEPGRTRIIYTGAMGVINETDLMMDVVELLRYRPEIEFVFIGSGTNKAAMQMRAKDAGLTNISFLSPVARKEIGRCFSDAQIAMVATRPGFYSEVGLHNKMFDYMGAGLPVVISGSGDIREIIESANCGLVVEPGNAKDFAAALLYLSENPQICAAMGRRGRLYVDKHYHRAKLLAEYEQLLKGLCTAPKQDVRDQGGEL